MNETAMRVANAPVSFGVNEILPDDAWMPEPDQILDMMARIGYEGTELGPPGYLGDARQLRERLSARDLALVGSFLPLHFSRAERAEEERAWLRDQLRLITDGAPEGSRPLAILCDGFGEPDRFAYAGRIPEHPEAWLPQQRFRVLMDNLHRAAEICRKADLEAVLHFHAGTYIESDAEIRRVVEAMDPALLGLVLDTGHAAFGGADPTSLANDYHELIRHVHVKDCKLGVMAEVKREGKGLAEALDRGVFTELGQGDSGIDRVIEVLTAHGYRGWLVVEQDRFLRRNDTLEALYEAQLRNRQYLRGLGI